MDWLQVLILSIVQGVTEFLPISSSAHLILVPQLTLWPDQGLAFDVALHVGSLSAVIIYFRHELQRMIASWFSSVLGKGTDEDGRLAWWVILATLPVCVMALLFDDTIESVMRSPLVIAVGMVIFGLALGVADWRYRGNRSEYRLGLKDVLVIGCAQALALIPGTSRSGITITAALMVGMNREAAARFSFLLSIPVILLAGGTEIGSLIINPVPIDWAALWMGILLSGVSAFLCIHYFLVFIKRIGMQPFVIYRIVFGLWLLWYFW